VFVTGCASGSGHSPQAGEFDGGGALGFVGSGGGADGGGADAAGPDGGGGTRDGGGFSDGAVTTVDDDAAAMTRIDGATSTNGGTPMDGGNFQDSGSNVGVTVNVPPGFFPALNWAITGPAGQYSGTVVFGDAGSYEFVVGGIRSGDGYALTLSGTNIFGDPCSGTSAPFQVSPGGLAGAGVAIVCQTGDAQAAVVTTGSVGVDAAVVL
jgi:hypothetical protein